MTQIDYEIKIFYISFFSFGGNAPNPTRGRLIKIVVAPPGDKKMGGVSAPL